MFEKVLVVRPEGLYCPAGDFYLDPRGKVNKAVVTHAHSDHGRPGHQHYLCSSPCLPLLRHRLGAGISAECLPFGESITIGDARLSFHPAGHILGSAQVRVEVGGSVWVVSGDYKPQADQTCEPFELVPCDGFISECTFGLPVYRWKAEEEVHAEINDWWKENAGQGMPSVLFAYSLGKAQRVLAGLDPSIGSIFAHSAIHPFLPLYAESGIQLPKVCRVNGQPRDWSDSIIIAPPAVEDTKWLNRFRGARKAFASGWMAIRGARRRRNLDRGFVLSDHADWDGLVNVIEETGAEEIKMTHGNGDALVRYLRERGKNASLLENAVLRGEEE